MSGIFVSYRRADTSGYASRLYAELTREFGKAQVFRDTKSIQGGRDFLPAIEAAIVSSSVVLVVIGREWVSSQNEAGRRLDDPDDVVRLEVAAALRLGKLVVPVLVEGAGLPAQHDLPVPLQPLVRKHAITLSDEHWDDDLRGLVETIEAAPDGPRRSRWPPWLRPQATLRWMASAVVVTSAILGILGVSARSLSDPGSPPAMRGDFNIAVAEFAASDPSGRPIESADGRELAESDFERLRGEVASQELANFDIDLRGPGQIGRLRGSTPAERARSAEQQANEIKADLVLYGTLRANELETEFAPEFFLNQRKLEGAEELVGQHELGSKVETGGDVTRNPAARRELRDQLLARTRAMAEFVVGLSYYSLDRFSDALTHLQAAERAEGWPEADGKELLFLFLGNAAGGSGDVSAAGRFYGKALELEPEYARALLGSAEVMFHQARGGCEEGSVDAPGLTTALAAYQRARTARVQPALSDIGTKAAFGIGRVNLCLSQAVVADRWWDAEQQFLEVIREFEAGNRRVRALAAEAHGNLGLVYLPVAGAPGAEASYRQAVDEFRVAVELTRRPDRKSVFLAQQGFIYGRLGRLEEADAAYAEAIRLAPDAIVRGQYEQARRQLWAVS